MREQQSLCSLTFHVLMNHLRILSDRWFPFWSGVGLQADC